MTLPPPSIVALRAVRQYRRRDVVPYLALRYYLENRSARRERWANDVAVRLATDGSAAGYFAVQHFKERDADGAIRHRDLYLPGANEALAEAALLDECSRHLVFANPPSVFSNDLARDGEIDGVFRPYIDGVQARHRAVAIACRSNENSIVQYADIQAFYPSIPPGAARTAWTAACSQTDMPARMAMLGRRLIEKQLAQNPRGRPQILTGPMFSHLLGNLVLRDLDAEMSAFPNVHYFRYVDDIILVGRQESVTKALQRARGLLEATELQLHPDDSAKHFVVAGAEWLQGEHDFHEVLGPVRWMTLVAGLKWLLTGEPGRHDEVQRALLDAGFRLPVPDYRHAIRERTYLDRLKVYVRRRWFRDKQRTLGELVDDVRRLRLQYTQEVEELLSGLEKLAGYQRRRTLPKLRYRAGRLAYMASRQQLAALSEELRRIPELEFHAAALAGIATGDVTEVIRFGTNVTQAVAQALHAEGRVATIQGPIKTPVEVCGLGVLALNGVQVSGEGAAEWSHDEFLRIARDGVTRQLMGSENSFVREFASLHGLGAPRHSDILDTAFHEADDAEFDVLSQLVFSASD